MEVLRQNQPTLKRPHATNTPRVRLWFWNPAGAQSLTCPAQEAKLLKERLIAEGAVVWQTTALDA